MAREKRNGKGKEKVQPAKRWTMEERELLLDFFFVYSLLACDLCRSWRGYVQSVFCPLSVQWRLVASTLFALHPGLSQE